MTKELLQGEERAGSRPPESPYWAFLLSAHSISLEILRTVPHSPALSKFFVTEFSFPDTIVVASSFGRLSCWAITLLFSVNPKSCVLWCFPPTNNFNFLFLPQPAMAPWYFRLGCLCPSLRPCYFSLALTLSWLIYSALALRNLKVSAQPWAQDRISLVWVFELNSWRPEIPKIKCTCDPGP